MRALRITKACLTVALLLATHVAAGHGAETSILIDAETSSHTISPMLFGDQIQWLGFGQDLLEVTSASPTEMRLRTDVLDELRRTIDTEFAGSLNVLFLFYYQWMAAVNQSA